LRFLKLLTLDVKTNYTIIFENSKVKKIQIHHLILSTGGVTKVRVARCELRVARRTFKGFNLIIIGTFENLSLWLSSTCHYGFWGFVIECFKGFSFFNFPLTSS